MRARLAVALLVVLALVGSAEGLRGAVLAPAPRAGDLAEAVGLAAALAPGAARPRVEVGPDASPLFRALASDPWRADAAAVALARELLADVEARAPSLVLASAARLRGAAPAPLPGDPASARDLAAALRALRASEGLPPTPRATEDAVAALPRELAEALAPAVAGASAARPLVAEALAGLAHGDAARLLAAAHARDDAPTLQDPGLRAALDRVDASALVAAGVAAARGLEASAALLRAIPTPLARGGNDVVFEDAAAGVLVTGPGSSVFTEDATLLIDLGGDDRYLNSAGGAYGAPTDPYGQPVERRPVSLVLDLGGADAYARRDLDAVQGGAVFGVGVLFDLEGDDTYDAGSSVTFLGSFSQGGGGPAGVGILYDAAGADVIADADFSRGAGSFGGIGLLLDGDGGARTTGALGDGMARALGVGIVVSGGAGSEERRACCMAHGRADDGGIGILVDGGGDDVYASRWWSQGSGFGNQAVGLLVDLGGHDRYAATESSQGAAEAGSAGLLVDLGGGRDTYSAQWGQGLAWGRSLALLSDDGGDDAYALSDSGQGSAAAGSLAALADGGGSDTYLAGYFAQGTAWGGGVGVLFDASGSDRYTVAYPGGPTYYGQGAGLWPGSLGALVDGGGDDAYDFVGLGAQGDGLGGGAGVFLELGGDDRYAADAPARGGSESGGTALFWDLAGRDAYASGPGADDTAWNQGPLGRGVDGVPLPS